jgi:hypothetical protein
MHQKGAGGSIDYEDGMLTIHRGHMIQSGDGVDTVQIPSTSITEIKWIPHTIMTNGSVTISFMMPDGSVHNEPDKIRALDNSPYRLIFRHGQEDGAKSIVEAVTADLTGSPIPLPTELEVHPKTYVTAFAGDDGQLLKLDGDSIQCGTETKPLAGATASIEDGSEQHSRVTLTRMALAGPFAFAMKKKSGGEKYVVISGEGFSWSVMVNAKRVAAAVKFVNKVNGIASGLTPKASETTQTAPIPADQLRELASLHDSGILTDEEFAAKKKDLLGLN